MLSFLWWYLLISLVGWLAFPLAYRFLGRLADRGLALSRPLGLLVWAYAFWLLTSLQLSQNDPGGMILALALLTGLSAWAVWGAGWQELLGWLRAHLRQVAVTEVLFLLAFAAWAAVRSVSPDAVGTEKPMEQAFINAILRSPSFPPLDPWLSGYSISYYYFGYVMVAMLTRLTQTASGVAFNLAGALWFALTAVSVYGVVFALLSAWAQRRPDRPAWTMQLWALLGPLFILIASNVEGVFEVLHDRGVFWTKMPDGSLQSSFWRWLNIQELVNPPIEPLGGVLDRPGIVWWRASRVLQDFNLRGESQEIIDEFPFFSYYLADLHPHVLAMPFVLLAVALAFNLYLGGGKEAFAALKPGEWLRRADFWLAAVALGSLAFLNTWDFPIYVGLYILVYGFLRYQQEGWNFRRLVTEVFAFALVLGAVGVVLFLPFYVGFSSQAGGLVPSMAFHTRGVFFWVMFATLLVPILLWLGMEWRKPLELWLGAGALVAGIVLTSWLSDPPAGGLVVLLIVLFVVYWFGTEAIRRSLQFAYAVVFGLWAASLLYGWGVANLPLLANTLFSFSSEEQTAVQQLALKMADAGNRFMGLHAAQSIGELFSAALMRRLEQPGTWLVLLLILAGVWGLLWRFGAGNQAAGTEKGKAKRIPEPTAVDPSGFVLLLVLLGAGLALFPEFFYLRDQFGWRMNTIFKFYFQVWMTWGVAAAYATVVVWNSVDSLAKWLARCFVSLVFVVCSLVYPLIMLDLRLTPPQNAGQPVSFTEWTKEWDLDGNAHVAKYTPDEMQAIQWLAQAPLGVVSEAVGGSYSAYARVSTLSGMPTVLGWPGHESQWRGGAKEMGTRQDDLAALYQSSDWNATEEILRRYNIRYIYLGGLERAAYRVNEAKFQRNLKPVYQNASVVIYGATQ